MPDTRRKLADFVGEDNLPAFRHYVVFEGDKFPHKPDDFSVLAGFRNLPEAKSFADFKNRGMYATPIAYAVWDGPEDLE